MPREVRSETEVKMKAHLNLGEHIFVFREHDRNVRHATIPGQDARRLAGAGLRELLLGEGDPHQHIVAGNVITLIRRRLNAIRVIEIRSEIKRRMKGSMVSQVIHLYVLKPGHIILEEVLVAVQLHDRPQEGNWSSMFFLTKDTRWLPFLRSGAYKASPMTFLSLQYV